MNMNANANAKKRVGIVGARGYVGGELLRLLAAHPGFEVAWVTSSREAGALVKDSIPHAPEQLRFDAPNPAALAARTVDVVFLGLPNGESEPWVCAFCTHSPRTVIVDISSDHRGPSPTAAGWVYGNPERHRAQIVQSTRIANPGCYATAMQLALAPLVARIAGPAHVFGVSGYSGAGATPSAKNDPEVLRDNIVPYRLVDHMHEHEVSHELAHPMCFVPHVAPFFRGLIVTCTFAVREKTNTAELYALLRAAYEGEPFVRVSDAAPLARDMVMRHDVHIGGLTVSNDGTHGAVVAALDNLLAGAATQAIRNANLATGQPEALGLS